MKEKISALMDDELERHEAGGALRELEAEGEARDAWRRYHLIGDAMRDARPLSAGFAARVSERLAKEPTVLAPGRIVASQPAVRRWQMLSAAASVAAVAMVGWVAFAPQREAVPVAQEQPAPVETAQVKQVAPPDAANDYLLAHQGYSPRNSLQGVAPYVRMVSGETGPRKP